MPDIYSVRRLSVYDRCAFFNAGTCVSACGPTTCRENQSFGKTAKSDPENHRKDASQSRSNGRGRWALMFSEQTAEDHISLSRTGTRGSSKYHFFQGDNRTSGDRLSLRQSAIGVAKGTWSAGMQAAVGEAQRNHMPLQISLRPPRSNSVLPEAGKSFEPYISHPSAEITKGRGSLRQLYDKPKDMGPH